MHDAFGTVHRAEATTYGIAQYAPIACAGPLLAAEIDAINKALASPKRPLVAIVAGSKVSSKLTTVQALARNVDQLIVGGGIANTFMLAAGLNIGKSLAAQLKAAGTIVWNGPVGVFEFAAFENGTKAIANAIAESSAFSIAGGGAFLEVLEGKTLPAFEILQKRAAELFATKKIAIRAYFARARGLFHP